MSIKGSPLYNPDLAPITTERRTWSKRNIAALWVAMSVAIPTYTLASGLITQGMNCIKWLENLSAPFLLAMGLGLPLTMALYSGIGIVVTSATIVICGSPIWDPGQLIARFDSPSLILFALLSLSVATLSTNIVANVVSPANDSWPKLTCYRQKMFPASSLASTTSPGSSVFSSPSSPTS